MKKIITALLNEQLNKKLNTKEIQVISEDIQYQEALLEILERNSNIDFLLLNYNIPGEEDIFKLIEKIKQINFKIKIIIFLDKKDEEIKNKLFSKGVYYIFIDGEIETEKIIELIIDENIENQEIKEEIENLRKIIIENNLIKNNEKKPIKNIIKFKKEKKQEIIKKENKIISIAGSYGAGKSIFSSIISKEISKKGKKVLLIDFDILNSSIHTIFGVKKYLKNNEIINKKYKNLHLMCGVDLIFNSKNKIDDKKLKELFNKLRKDYDCIIIDNSAECFFKYTKIILENSDKIIFLIEPNLIEIKKSKNLLNIYLKEWNIQKDKIHIIFNKINEKIIRKKMLKNIFENIDIIGKINYDKNYNKIINNNMNEIYFLKNRKEEYKKIVEAIL